MSTLMLARYTTMLSSSIIGHLLPDCKHSHITAQSTRTSSNASTRRSERDTTVGRLRISLKITLELFLLEKRVTNSPMAVYIAKTKDLTLTYMHRPSGSDRLKKK